MKTDIALAVLGSLAIHAGVAFGDRLLPAGDAAPTTVVDEKAPVIEIALPLVEPDKPDVSDEPVDAAATPASAADLAPPSLADTPTATIDSPFVQQLEAPRPAGPSLAGTAVVIPVGAGAPGLRNAAAALFDLASLDQAPVALAQLPPDYPASLRRRGVAGEVLIRFVVDAQGRVRNAVVVRSTESGFEQAALDAVARWRFKPGRKGGAAVNTRMEIPLEFRLR